jgi:hypothetical protein
MVWSQIREKRQLVMSTSFRGQYRKRYWMAERSSLVAGFLIPPNPQKEAEYDKEKDKNVGMDIMRYRFWGHSLQFDARVW